MHIKSSFFVVALGLGIVGCSSTEDTCEDVTLAAEQVHECQVLHRKIVQAKDKPLIRTELERRYEQNCVAVRYYRDDKQNAICGNKQKIGEIEQALKKEQKQ